MMTCIRFKKKYFPAVQILSNSTQYVYILPIAIQIWCSVDNTTFRLTVGMVTLMNFIEFLFTMNKSVEVVYQCFFNESNLSLASHFKIGANFGARPLCIYTISLSPSYRYSSHLLLFTRWRIIKT